MANNRSIQILRGSTDYDPLTSTEILEEGQPFYSKKDKQLYVGEDEKTIRNLKPVSANTQGGSGKYSTQQVQDGTTGTFDFTNKNPNATAIDSTLTGQIAYGGQGAFAASFGGKSSAQGKRSFACGTTTIAKGAYSFASGDNSVALGTDSHAEGTMTTAVGYSSHAEGNNTITKSQASHAEGNGSKAYGLGAHAEGNSTLASGDNSHAEGDTSQTQGKTSHAEGSKSIAYGEGSHAEGVDSQTKNATYSRPSDSGSGGTSSGGTTTDPQTDMTKFFGVGAHAEGAETVASGYVAHAEGYRTIANGHVSHAEGSNTDATGNYSHAEGVGSKASGEISHAEGVNTIASGRFSHAEGDTSQAQGKTSHAEGSKSIAYGEGSHAEGASTKASGGYSHAEGSSTTASGTYSHAEGSSTTASDIASHAEGSSTTASGTYSHAEGHKTTASGYYAHTEGYLTAASHHASHAGGSNTQTGAARQTVIGYYNEGKSNTYFEVGNGTSDTDRKNAFEVLFDGRAKVQSAPTDDDDVVRLKELNNTKDSLMSYLNLNSGQINMCVKISSAAAGQLYCKSTDESVKGITYSDSSSNNTIVQRTSSGSIYAYSYYATSDKRLKENINEYKFGKSVLDLPIYSFNYISDETKKKQIGCLAQDLQEICPELVIEDTNGYLSVNDSKVVYLLLDEVKKLNKKINELEGKLNGII